MNKPRVTSDISLGHIITAASVLVGVTLTWGALRGDVEKNAYRIGQTEQRTAALEQQAQIVALGVARIEVILERIEEKQTNGG